MSPSLPPLFRYEFWSFLIPILISTSLLIHLESFSAWHIPLFGGMLAIYTAIKIDQIWSSDWSATLRLLTSYGFMLWIYISIADFIPLLDLEPKDEVLLEIDRFLFGETPAFQIQPSPWLTEIMSFGYLSYHFYIHGSMLTTALINPTQAHRIFAFVFPAFSLGVIGYFLVPATGPWQAYPHDFIHPLQGGFLTEINTQIVVQGSSVYDVFPSLHTLGTLVLLDHDRNYRPTLFKMMLPISLLLIASTLYLRYHYAIDVLAGCLLFILIRKSNWRWVELNK